MNITTCNVCGQAIPFGQGTFESGVHDECFWKKKK